MTLEPASATAPAGAAGAAVAVPVGRASMRAAAAMAAGPLRVGRCRRRVDGREGCRTVRISHPQERRITVIGGGAPTATLLRSVCERKTHGDTGLDSPFAIEAVG